MYTEPPDQAVGSALRAARVHSGWTIRGLAERIGLSTATISQLENGKARLTVARLYEIAQVLDKPVEHILPGQAQQPVTEAEPGSPLSTIAHDDEAPPPPALPTKEVRQPDLADGRWRHYPPRAFDPVLEAALSEFLEVGYHGSSVRQIAQRCGMSVSGLYHHYASKQEMLRRILQLAMTDLSNRSCAAREEGADPVQRFCLLVENLALWHTYRHELGFVGAAEMRSLDPPNRYEVAKLRTREQRKIDHEAEEACAYGEFHTVHPRQASRAIVSMCTALPQWYKEDGPHSPETIAGQYVGFALDLMKYRTAG
jgi:AcrR family transcriptional regulator/transcriptional regulator with XRE-family HTH domain